MENIEKYTDKYLNDIIINGVFQTISAKDIHKFLNFFPKEKIILLYSIKEETYLLGYWKIPNLSLIKRCFNGLWIKNGGFPWNISSIFSEEYYYFELEDRQSISNIPVCCGKEMEYLSLAYKCPECWKVI